MASIKGNFGLLNTIVHGCLQKYVGGEAFFDKLDLSIRNTRIVNLLLQQGVVNYQNVVVSGRFGAFFVANYQPLFSNIILTEGGLRHTVENFSLDCYRGLIAGRNFIFVDDSFYSGNTREHLRKEIERLGGELTQSFVIYDGSKSHDDSVFSLFRYYT